MLRICRAEGRSDPLLWILACQTTAGAIPPEVLKRKRYFGLGDDTAEVWDPDAAREADEHTARCANEGYAAEGFVDSDYVRMLRGITTFVTLQPDAARRWRQRRVTPPRRHRSGCTSPRVSRDSTRRTLRADTRRVDGA